MHSSARKVRRTTEALRVGASRARALVACVALGACAASAKAPTDAPVGVSNVTTGSPVPFQFDSLDSRPVTSEAMRGKPTLLVFVQTLELWSTAELDYVIAMAAHDGDRVNYAMVALETAPGREMFEIWHEKLKAPFPGALADADTLYGTGPFGVLKVPTTILLDRSGRVVWEVMGRAATSQEIREQMKGL